MEDSFSAEADGCSTSQQIPCYLQDLKGNRHVQRNCPLVSVTTQTNPDNSHPIPSRSTLTLLVPGCMVNMSKQRNTETYSKYKSCTIQWYDCCWNLVDKKEAYNLTSKPLATWH